MTTAVIEETLEGMDLNERNVRKWGQAAFGISAYGDATVKVPTTVEELFNPTTHKPTSWPQGVKRMGWITTDGMSLGKDVSSNNTPGLQSLYPVRTDMESIEETLGVNFLEANGFTEALYRLLPVEAWPETKDGAYGFKGAGAADIPDYVLWLVLKDGAGSNAVYKHRVIHRSRINGLEDRNQNRGDPETFGCTFGLFRDPVSGLVDVEASDGPGKPTHLAAPPTTP